MHGKSTTHWAISSIHSQHSERKKEVFLIAGKVVLLALCEAVMGFSCDVGECGCPSRQLAMALLFLASKIWGSEADTGTRKHMPES